MQPWRKVKESNPRLSTAWFSRPVAHHCTLPSIVLAEEAGIEPTTRKELRLSRTLGEPNAISSIILAGSVGIEPTWEGLESSLVPDRNLHILW